MWAPAWSWVRRYTARTRTSPTRLTPLGTLTRTTRRITTTRTRCPTGESTIARPRATTVARRIIAARHIIEASRTTAGAGPTRIAVVPPTTAAGLAPITAGPPAVGTVAARDTSARGASPGDWAIAWPADSSQAPSDRLTPHRSRNILTACRCDSARSLCSSRSPAR